MKRLMPSHVESMEYLHEKDLKERIGDLYREVNTKEYDRAETVLCGYEVRVWRARVKCRLVVYLGYKPSWSETWIKTKKSQLVEILRRQQFRGRGT